MGMPADEFLDLRVDPAGKPRGVQKRGRRGRGFESRTKRAYLFFADFLPFFFVVFFDVFLLAASTFTPFCSSTPSQEVKGSGLDPWR
jgi:hypothetical protein